MSALTDYRNTLTGVTVVRNFEWDSGTTTLKDRSANAVDGTNVGTPTTSGTDIRPADGSRMAEFDGSSDAVNLGTMGALIDAIDGAGITVAFDYVHTYPDTGVNRDIVFGGVQSNVRNGVAVTFNANTLGNHDANGTGLAVKLYDSTGGTRVYQWSSATANLFKDGVPHRAHLFISATAAKLYIDGTQMPSPNVSDGSYAGTFGSSTGVMGFGGIGFGASVVVDNTLYQGHAANLLLATGEMTLAQIREDLGVGNTNADGQPLCYVFRADTGVLAETGPDVAAGEDDPIIIWREQNAQLELSTLGYTAGALRDTANEDPRLVIEHNGNVPTVAFDNNFSTTGFDAYLGAGGFRRNMMGVSSLTARRQVKATNLTMWFIGRVPSLIPLGGTVQGIIGLFSGGTLRAGLGISSTGGRNQVRWYENGGATSRVPLDADVPDCRNGPSLVYCEVSVGHDGACTVTMNRWSGSTTSAATVTNFACDEIRIGSWDVTTNGSNAVLWGCEFGISRCASTATERAARLARAFRAYSSGGWGLPGETANPRKHVRVFDDSLSVQYSKRCLGWPMLLPKACVRDTSWHMINIAGMDLVDASPDILDFAPDNAGRKDAGATKRLLIVKLCTNDALASDTGSQINADLGTVLAAVTDVDDITACGLMDNVNATKRSDYQALINARVGSSITRAIAMPDIASRTVDGIHPDQESAMQDMANAIWYGNLPGGAGGGLAAALGGGAGAGRGGLGGAAFRARGDRRGLLIGAAG